MKLQDLLSAFDPAPTAVYDDVAAVRAKARLEQIVATDPTLAPQPVMVPRRRARLAQVRWVAIPALAAGALIAGVMAPGGGLVAPAFAGWTPIPMRLDGPAIAAVESVCRTAIDGLGCEVVRNPLRMEQELLLAERRGDISIAIFQGIQPERPNPLIDIQESALCIVVNTDDRPTVAALEGRRSNAWGNTLIISSSPSEEEFPFAASGGFRGPTPLRMRPNAVVLNFAVGWNWPDHGEFAILQGWVGDNVTDVVLHTDHGDVETTLADGRFLAWLPMMPNINWMIRRFDRTPFGATVTLEDGTTLEVAHLPAWIAND